MERWKSGDVLAIDYDRLLEIYFQNPEFGYYFLRLATDRLLQNNTRLQGLVEQSHKGQPVAAAKAPLRETSAQEVEADASPS